MQHLCVVLNGCETWSLTLYEEYRLRVFKTHCWKKSLGLGGRKSLETQENCIMRNFIMMCTPYQILFRWWNKKKLNEWDKWHVGGTIQGWGGHGRCPREQRDNTKKTQKTHRVIKQGRYCTMVNNFLILINCKYVTN